MMTRPVLIRKFTRNIPVFILALIGVAAAADLTPERLINAAAEPQNWFIYGGTYNAWRFSALNQINRDNVRKLVPVWAFQTGKSEGGLHAHQRYKAVRLQHHRRSARGQR
jgi:alcohol dehydrogenase (cytochrome c)